MSAARRSAARPPRRFAPPLLGRRGKNFRLSLRRAKLRRRELEITAQQHASRGVHAVGGAALVGKTGGELVFAVTVEQCHIQSDAELLRKVVFQSHGRTDKPGVDL